MRGLCILSMVVGLCASTAVLADSIHGGPNGVVVTSTNDGSVTSTGVFNSKTTIRGGKGNTIGVSAVGSGVSVFILKEDADTFESQDDSTIIVKSITSTNTGNITASGTFNRSVVRGGEANGMSVSAAGSQVNVSIIKR